MTSSAIKWVLFDEVIEDRSGGNSKIQKGDYKAAGPFPIVDQGQEFIGGFADDIGAIVSGTGPWIVFGDHTRILKYIDFPFCMGADGVKVLQLNPNVQADLKYVFHYLKAADIPSAGYSRHFKFLKRLKIPLPPLSEQKRIAAILDQADALRQKRKKAIALLDSLTQSIFLDMFGDPVTNPKGWQFAELSSLIKKGDKINYGVVQPGENEENGVKLIRVSDLHDGVVDHSQLRNVATHISKKHSNSVLTGDEILVTCVGSIGEVALVSNNEKGFNIARAVARIPVDPKYSRLFISEYLRTEHVQRYFTKELRISSQPTLNIKQINETPVVMPASNLVSKFESAIHKLTPVATTSKTQYDKTNRMFYSLQHKAFSGSL